MTFPHLRQAHRYWTTLPLCSDFSLTMEKAMTTPRKTHALLRKKSMITNNTLRPSNTVGLGISRTLLVSGFWSLGAMSRNEIIHSGACSLTIFIGRRKPIPFFQGIMPALLVRWNDIQAGCIPGLNHQRFIRGLLEGYPWALKRLTT